MLIRMLLIGALAAGFAVAQDEGGGGGGGGRGGGGVVPGVPRSMPSVLDRMATACNLSKDQKKEFKTILDSAGKEGEPLRKQIPQSRADVAAALQAGKAPDQVKTLVEANAAARAQMTQLEMKTFAALYKLMDADQRKQGAQRVFSSMTGLFMKKNWDN